MSEYLLLGPVSFAGFEVPARIGFGGAQRLAVHQLPGGARVVDAMGRDDADIAWSGAFSGPDAADRARLLDLMRAEGTPLPLAWDAFCYTVVIAEFEAHYQHPNWVPYRIVCLVVLDQTEVATEITLDLATGLLTDLARAQGGFDVSGAVAALGVAGATAPGSLAYATALGHLVTTAKGIDVRMAVAGTDLTTASDLAATAAAAGQLAALADARGYAGRALDNLMNVV